ncbi:hypothetical protein K439DRAFT_1623533 [Ramaria rubella]|nr:hypothetical protein K439DRAFT_1623533 [Ramaria rubella]
MESTAKFPVFNGPPGYFAIEGKLFHHFRSTHQNSAVRWLLYNGFMHSFAPHQQWINVLPVEWVTVMKEVMLRVNPFASHLRQLSLAYSFGFPQAILNEDDVSNKIAAIISYTNTSEMQIQSRTMVISQLDSK